MVNRVIFEFECDRCHEVRRHEQGRGPNAERFSIEIKDQSDGPVKNETFSETMCEICRAKFLGWWEEGEDKE